MAATPQLKLYNTLTREKSVFTPIDAANVRMYVCGPTVYDYAHIGNARPAIVFDVLYRLLRHLYGEAHVTYVRNITDVDDKINARALRDHPGMELNAAIRLVTEKTEAQYRRDVKALGCLEPTVQPRATEHIAKMVEINQRLIDRGHAYVADGPDGREVLFATASMPDYGQLSRRRLDEQQAGARIAVEAHKKNPADFVLWKESAEDQPGWHASYLVGGETVTIHGRPGWHIECSAMSQVHLGEVFDIHGGGLDLIFPHHENEIAQSRCAHGTDVMANVWMHNGFLQVEGRKMSKSEGNFVTIDDLLRTDKFGGRPWHGGVLRLAMLKTHYRQPIDWTTESLMKCRHEMFSFVASCSSEMAVSKITAKRQLGRVLEQDERLISALSDDLNTAEAISVLFELRDAARSDAGAAEKLFLGLEMLGILDLQKVATYDQVYISDIGTRALLAGRDDFGRIERLRVSLANNDVQGIQSLVSEIESWGVAVNVNETTGTVSIDSAIDERRQIEGEIQRQIDRRKELLKARNFAEADKIRDDLLARGIQLKDGKDPVTGERVTTWEVKR